MVIELARTRAVPKPWGVADPRPWNRVAKDGMSTGEIWYERASKQTAQSSLLLKLLFTSQPLSVQVHPDDAYARSMGLPNGKTEAWYVLSAAPHAKVALGLKQSITAQQLRQTIADGSIAELVVWQAVAAGDVIFVPAGTIHAIGTDLVIAEIQQRSDATFRMYDHGRQRDLHIERAIAVAETGPAEAQVQPNRLTDERTLLLSNQAFVFERIEFAPGAAWDLDAQRETWLLVVGGSASAGAFGLSTGDAIFAEADRVALRAGEIGLECLVAYTGEGGPIPHFLQRPARQAPNSARRSSEVSTVHMPAPAAAANGRIGPLQ
jgi:mannose-6-phosphate isomerase